MSRKDPAPTLKELAPALTTPGMFGMMAGTRSPGDAPEECAGAEIYAAMQHDPQVKACLATKKFAVLSKGWEVHAAGEAPADQEIAAFVRRQLSGMQGSVLDALSDVLDALARGTSLLEINWKLNEDGPDAGRIGLRSLKAKDPAGFVFETDEFLNLTALRGVLGAAYPPDKFLLYAYLPCYAAPTGRSDLRAAYRPWFLKRQLLTWWVKYLEKFGLPTVMGSYPATAAYGADQQRQLLSIVAAVHNESAVVLPDDIQLGLLEASRPTVAGFEQAIAYLDRAIAKSILGQTLTSDSTGGGSTFALGQVHLDVLGYYLNKLQRDLEETVIGQQLIARLVAYNFGPGVAAPTFHLGPVDDSRLATVGALIKDLIAGQVISPDEPWIRGYLGLPAAN